MKKDNDEIDRGKIAFQARSSCVPSGIPNMFLPGNPLMILQTPKEVLMIKEGGVEIRHVYLDVPHSAKVKPSWYGESVGHYEGDTLVVDTIGQNSKTVVDAFRTPHTEKLHVVERWHLVDGGKALEVNFTVDDPDTFNQPWSTYVRHVRGQRAVLRGHLRREQFEPLRLPHAGGAEAGFLIGPAGLKIRLPGARDRRVPVVVILTRVFGADAFRPISQHGPVGDQSTPWLGECFRVFHCYFDLQAGFAVIRIDIAPAVFVGERA